MCNNPCRVSCDSHAWKTTEGVSYHTLLSGTQTELNVPVIIADVQCHCFICRIDERWQEENKTPEMSKSLTDTWNRKHHHFNTSMTGLSVIEIFSLHEVTKIMTWIDRLVFPRYCLFVIDCLTFPKRYITSPIVSVTVIIDQHKTHFHFDYPKRRECIFIWRERHKSPVDPLSVTSL